MFIAAGVVKASTSFPSSIYNNSDNKKEYIFADIVLTGSKSRSEICGRVNISQETLCNSRITEGESFRYNALVVELQGEINVTNSDGEKVTLPLKHLSAEEDCELICNSTIFALVSGSKRGIQKGDQTETRNLLMPNPASFKFKIELPQTQQQFPGSIESSNISVNYILLLYIRTANGYEELERRPFQKFMGHHLISFQDECINESTTFNEMVAKTSKLRLSSAQKYYLIKQPIFFTVTLDSFHSIGENASIVVKLLQIVSIKGKKVQEYILDSKKSKFMGKTTFCGKLLENGKTSSLSPLIPVLPSFNHDNRQESSLQIQHFLKCQLEGYSGIEDQLEEIIIGTGRIICPATPRTDESSFLSRIRSQSVSSLLSLLPPSYSNLSSRRGSQVSLETLPPHYDDVQQEK